MPTLPVFQVDAFTTQPLQGNPCAVVLDADGLSESTMQAIAREMNLSETAFVLASETADVAARYFTPAEEIPMAGHPTIATIMALVDSGRLRPAADGVTTVMLELRVGPIPVDIHSRQGRVERIVMTQKPPQFLATYEPAQIMPVFGLQPQDCLPDVPIQTVSTGTPAVDASAAGYRGAAPGDGGYRRVQCPACQRRLFQPASVLCAGRDGNRPHLRPSFWHTTGYLRGPFHRLCHRRHGSLSVALWPH